MSNTLPLETYSVRLGNYWVFLVQATDPIQAISRASELYPLASGKSFDVKSTRVEARRLSAAEAFKVPHET